MTTPSSSDKKMPPLDTQRLNRIEDKIDKLAEVVIDMARAEERINTLFKSQAIITENTLKLEERLSEIEASTSGVVNSHRNLSRIFWSVISTLAGAAVLYAFGLQH